MQVNVAKWGNSLGVRIPRSIANQVGIIEGIPVDLIVEDNHILIQKSYNLESLLAQINPKNIHSEVESGPAVGNEVW